MPMEEMAAATTGLIPSRGWSEGDVKILHTADWHVGKTLRGRSRADEHRAVLDEIVAIAEREAVGIVLVAGDQFDRAVPSPESEEIVYDALLRLARTDAHVVVIAGNHDNPRRLAAVKPLLELTNVTAASRVARPDDGGVVRVRTKSGETACIALFPFQSKRGIVTAEALMGGDPDDHQKEYSDRCRRIAQVLCAGFTGDTINLVVAHLTVAGSAGDVGGMRGGGERDAHLFDYYVPADIFPESAHYVALGHIHRPQKIPGRCPIRYAGSPFAMDFGEKHGEHSVTLVEAGAGRPARVRPIPLTSGRALSTLRGNILQLERMAGTTGDDFLRVIVEQAPSPGLAEGVREMFPLAVDVLVRPEEPVGSPSPPPVDPRELRDPRSQFRRYLKEAGIEGEELARLFDELLEGEYAAATA